MERGAPEICVLGVGHLAAAVRVQLPLFGLSPEGDCADRRAHGRMVLACSDYVSTSSFADVNRRAIDDLWPILFAWISGSRVELGPLVVPLESPCFECQPARRWDFSLDAIAWCCVPVTAGTTLNPDTRLKSVAHLGALLVARELAGLRLGAPGARLIGRVAKFDPPSLYPEIVELARAPDCPVCGGRVRVIPANDGWLSSRSVE
jgi:bacteriocin biosynthesis cyclodehydratase domain-containing protein